MHSGSGSSGSDENLPFETLKQGVFRLRRRLRLFESLVYHMRPFCLLILDDCGVSNEITVYIHPVCADLISRWGDVLGNKSLICCFQVRGHLSVIPRAVAGPSPVCLNCSDINGKCLSMLPSL